MILLLTEAELPAVALTPLMMLAHRFPGGEQLRIVCGRRALTLGPEWRYEPSAACLAALQEFGEVLVRP